MDTTDPYPGRVAHWVRHNSTERIPHRWIVADSEARRRDIRGGEEQRLRCAVAVRWSDNPRAWADDEWADFTDAAEFWRWVTGHCRAGARTVTWFHNASYDLRTLDAFTVLPALGWELDWCNLDRDVSVASWRGVAGTLVIADTWTWLAKPLASVAGMVGIGKPRLPGPGASDAVWLARCRSDVEITAEAVRQLLAFVKAEGLGNWQPSGAGMGYATWRHKHLEHKVLVHNDAPALAAERQAMHTGRAEAWWHGQAPGGPFTEWDCHMAYPRIGAECDVPVKLFCHDGAVSAKVHEWARNKWVTLCRVQVRTQAPVVPHQDGQRTIWPVGEFETILWQPELDLIRETGGTYRVLEQWRYNAAPALASWARWSMAMCASPDARLTPVQRTWVKHQSRALIGRLGMRNRCWNEWGANPFGWVGLSDYLDAGTGETARMMHVGHKTFTEGERREASSSLPQITGYIMSECRARLWRAAAAAGLGHVMHLDTDSVITDAAGSRAIETAIEAGLPGGWRRKATWRQLEVTGPRHWRSTGRRVIPGVPAGAAEIEPGVFAGEVWQSLAGALGDRQPARVKVMSRQWRPRRFDGRRPWTGEGPAQPPRLGRQTEEVTAHDRSA
jgi:hypothetical protein